MKKQILLLLGIMTMATTSAADIKKSTSKIGVNYRYNDAVTFVERGVQFHVFLNGDFDFNTPSRNNRYYDYNGMRINNGVRIDRDYRGRIRRIGNVFVNYDMRGNVKRIGNVFMQYRFGQLSRVGNLLIDYDRWGYPHFRGYVKSRRDFNNYYGGSCGVGIDINLGSIFDYNDAYFFRNDFRRNYRKFKEDRNFLYYRAKPNAKIGKRSKILKRRKQNVEPLKDYSKTRKRLGKPEQTGKSRRSR